MSNSCGPKTRVEGELTNSVNVTERDTSVLLFDAHNISNNNCASDFDDALQGVDCNFVHKVSSESGIGSGEEESTPLLGVRKQTPSCGTSCCNFIRCITVEPWMFLVMFALFLQGVAMKNLIIQKVCIFTFGINDTECMNSTNGTIENYVQVQASNIEMYHNLVETVPAILVSVLLGAFGDHHSRKVPMLIPVVGYTISSVAIGFCAYFMEEIPPYYIPLTGIPKGLTGGIIAAMVAAFSYISDITTPEKRTMKLASLQGILMLGQPLGILAGGYISQYSYVLVFIIGSCSFTLSALYIVAFIRDPERQLVAKTAESSFCRKFFSLASYKDTLATFFKRREGNARFYILMLLGIITFILIPDLGQSTVLYLFLRLKFHWDLTTYSYFSSVSSVSTSLGLVFGVVIFVRILRLNDMMLAIIGLVGGIAVSLSFTFINTSSMIYMVCVPLLFCGTTSLGLRSTISKLVPGDEQGKVFSVLGAFEAITPFLSSLIYTQTYNATEATFPEAVFIMSASIYTIPLILVIIVAMDMRRRAYYATIK